MKARGERQEVEMEPEDGADEEGPANGDGHAESGGGTGEVGRAL